MFIHQIPPQVIIKSYTEKYFLYFLIVKKYMYTILAINNNPSCYCNMNITLKLNFLKNKRDFFFSFFLLK